MPHRVSFDSQFWQELINSYKLQLSCKSRASGFWLRTLALQVLLFALRLVGRNLFSVWCLKYSGFRYFLSNLDALQLLHTWMCDAYSQTLLTDILVRKILTQEYLRTLIDEDEERARFSLSESMILEKSTGLIKMGMMDFKLNYYDLASIGFPLRLHLHEMNIVWTFMSKQYRYQHGDIEIGVEQGDVVIDGGGCWGDSALYFASQNAKAVYSFEFVKENLSVFRSNLAENLTFSQIVSIVERALWNEDDIELNFESAGPGTSVQPNQLLGEKVRTISIDTFVEQRGIERIDFIKMDIEGGELKALEGARRTIERFTPRLAITVYHKQEDLCTIPHYLKSLCPDYEFFIDHFTTTMLETVLFVRRKIDAGESTSYSATIQESVLNHGN